MFHAQNGGHGYSWVHGAKGSVTVDQEDESKGIGSGLSYVQFGFGFGEKVDVVLG
jgi:hypothetical protein